MADVVCSEAFNGRLETGFSNKDYWRIIKPISSLTITEIAQKGVVESAVLAFRPLKTYLSHVNSS